MPYNYGRAGRQANTEAGTTAASAPSYGPAGSDRGLVTVTSPAGAKYQVSPVIASRVAGFLGELHDMGYDTLGQDENFGYAPRDVRDSPGTPSQHSFGNAIDINSRENHRLTHPELERTGITDSNLPANVDSIAAKYGLSWGGNYVTAKTDPMHFEGETFSSAQKAASPSVPMGIYGHKSADAIDHFTERKAKIEGVNPAQTAIDRSTAPPQTAGDRMRAILGLPATLSVEAANAIAQGVVSLGQLAAEVATESAAQQPNNPNAAAPPSSFPSRPAGPVSTNTFNSQNVPPSAVTSAPLSPVQRAQQAHQPAHPSTPTPRAAYSTNDWSSPFDDGLGDWTSPKLYNVPSDYGKPAAPYGLTGQSAQGDFRAAPSRNPNAGVIGAAPASDMRDSPAARMHAGLAASGVQASYDQASGRVSFSPTNANAGPQAAADRAGPPAAAGGLGGLIGSLGRAAMAGGSSTPAKPMGASLGNYGGYHPAAPSYGGPMAAADASNGYRSAAPAKASPQGYGGPMAAADASNRARPLSSLGLPSGMKTDYAGMDVGSLSQDGIAPDLGVSPAATMAERALNQQIADALSTGYAPGAVSNKKPGEPGYKPAAAPLAPKPAAARPAAPAAKPAARPAPARPQSPFAPGTDAFDAAGQLVGTVNGYGKFQAPSFAAGTAVTDQAGNVVGHYDNTGKMQKAEPLGFFGSIMAGLGFGGSPNGGQAAGIGGKKSAAGPALGLKGAGWGSSGNASMSGGYSTSNEGGNLHG